MLEHLKIIFILLYLIVFVIYSSDCDQLSREKRFLIWRTGASRIQVIVGLGVPVDLERETVIIGTVIKGNYKMPMNSSDYTHPYRDYAKRKRSVSRWNFYKMMAQAAEMRGFGGKACILRAICEMAETPVDKNYSLFNELLHLVFNPDQTDEQLNHHSDNEYFSAQHIGKTFTGRCKSYFSECKANLLDSFTLKRDMLPGWP